MPNYLQHVVRRGETLGKIAQANRTTIGELIALNALPDPDRIAIGQTLRIRRLSGNRYIVRSGDTLTEIAARHGSTVAALAQANRIRDPNSIAAGASLLIPAGLTPDGLILDGGAQTSEPPTRTQETDPAFAAANLRLPAANAMYHSFIIEASRKTDLAPHAIAAIIDAEAARIPATGQWNPGSKARTSSATGLTQFLDATWRGEARRAGGLLNAEAKLAGTVNAANAIADDAGLLMLRLNPRIAILAGADYAVANLAILRDAGVLAATPDPAGAAKLAYLAHHEGPGRAARFLRGRMGYVTPAILSANVPDAARRRMLIGAANGDVGAAYRKWLAGYVDATIDVRRFMANTVNVTIPRLSDFFA